MTPHADLFDGKLTFSFGYLPGRIRKLVALPRAFRSGEGNLIELPEIHEYHTTWLKIKINPTPTHSDGELFDLAATELEYTILPSKLPMLVDLNGGA